KTRPAEHRDRATHGGQKIAKEMAQGIRSAQPQHVYIFGPEQALRRFVDGLLIQAAGGCQHLLAFTLSETLNGCRVVLARTGNMLADTNTIERLSRCHVL